LNIGLLEGEDLEYHYTTGWIQSRDRNKSTIWPNSETRTRRRLFSWSREGRRIWWDILKQE